jgi:hypothetical protein
MSDTESDDANLFFDNDELTSDGSSGFFTDSDADSEESSPFIIGETKTLDVVRETIDHNVFLLDQNTVKDNVFNMLIPSYEDFAYRKRTSVAFNIKVDNFTREIMALYNKSVENASATSFEGCIPIIKGIFKVYPDEMESYRSQDHTWTSDNSVATNLESELQKREEILKSKTMSEANKALALDQLYVPFTFKSSVEDHKGQACDVIIPLDADKSNTSRTRILQNDGIPRLSGLLIEHPGKKTRTFDIREYNREVVDKLALNQRVTLYFHDDVMGIPLNVSSVKDYQVAEINSDSIKLKHSTLPELVYDRNIMSANGFTFSPLKTRSLFSSVAFIFDDDMDLNEQFQFAKPTATQRYKYLIASDSIGSVTPVPAIKTIKDADLYRQYMDIMIQMLPKRKSRRSTIERLNTNVKRHAKSREIPSILLFRDYPYKHTYLDEPIARINYMLNSMPDYGVSQFYNVASKDIDRQLLIKNERLAAAPFNPKSVAFKKMQDIIKDDCIVAKTWKDAHRIMNAKDEPPQEYILIQSTKPIVILCKRFLSPDNEEDWGWDTMTAEELTELIPKDHLWDAINNRVYPADHHLGWDSIIPDKSSSKGAALTQESLRKMIAYRNASRKRKYPWIYRPSEFKYDVKDLRIFIGNEVEQLFQDEEGFGITYAELAKDLDMVMDADLIEEDKTIEENDQDVELVIKLKEWYGLDQIHPKDLDILMNWIAVHFAEDAARSRYDAKLKAIAMTKGLTEDAKRNLIVKAKVAYQTDVSELKVEKTFCVIAFLLALEYHTDDKEVKHVIEKVSRRMKMLNAKMTVEELEARLAQHYHDITMKCKRFRKSSYITSIYQPLGDRMWRRWSTYRPIKSKQTDASSHAPLKIKNRLIDKSVQILRSAIVRQDMFGKMDFKNLTDKPLSSLSTKSYRSDHGDITLHRFLNANALFKDDVNLRGVGFSTSDFTTIDERIRESCEEITRILDHVGFQGIKDWEKFVQTYDRMKTYTDIDVKRDLLYEFIVNDFYVSLGRSVYMQDGSKMHGKKHLKYDLRKRMKETFQEDIHKSKLFGEYVESYLEGFEWVMENSTRNVQDLIFKTVKSKQDIRNNISVLLYVLVKTILALLASIMIEGGMIIKSDAKEYVLSLSSNVANISHGQRDIVRSLFAVWMSLFKKHEDVMMKPIINIIESYEAQREDMKQSIMNTMEKMSKDTKLLYLKMKNKGLNDFVNMEMIANQDLDEEQLPIEVEEEVDQVMNNNDDDGYDLIDEDQEDQGDADADNDDISIDRD